MEKTYKLLKKVESNSLPIWNKVRLWEHCSLSGWWAIPTQRLVEQWYLELVSDEKLVPDNVKFMQHNSNLVMYFNKKSLWYNYEFDDWFVGNYNTEEAEKLASKCNLVLTPFSSVEIWEWYIREYIDWSYYSRQDLYCLKVAENKHVFVNNNWKEVVESKEDDMILDYKVYKVVPFYI